MPKRRKATSKIWLIFIFTQTHAHWDGTLSLTHAHAHILPDGLLCDFVRFPGSASVSSAFRNTYFPPLGRLALQHCLFSLVYQDFPRNRWENNLLCLEVAKHRWQHDVIETSITYLTHTVTLMGRGVCLS